MSIETWNQRYTESADAAGSAPSPLVISQLADLSPGRALDLACGAGRNSLWLAHQGWNVTAVDGSHVAIETLRRRAAAANLSIEAVVADLEAHEFKIEPNSWDLILNYAYLQRDLFEPIKQGLRPGGIALVAVHLAEPHRESRFSLKPGELAANFKGWEMLHHYEGPPPDAPPDSRSFAEIVVRRP